ncbi:MAG: alkaline phosphatase [Bacteroidota bacterium]
MKPNNRILTNCLFATTALLWGWTMEAQGTGKPRNIIMIIGDGMGHTQVSAAYLHQTQGSGDGSWNMGRFTHFGYSVTTSSDALITDSGAGATALSTGRKTYNGAVGVGSDSLPLQTILEKAAATGRRTGMLVTCEVTHATPASYAAHRIDRDLYEDIALDLSLAPLDWLVGGGRNHFVTRRDQRNLLEEMRKVRGFKVMDRSEDLLKAPRSSAKQPVVALVWDGPAPPINEGRDPGLMAALTARACRDLDRPTPIVTNDSGFFLMIEGSQIDWGGHSNDGDYVLTETLDLDRVVGAALDFARQDGNTLVVLTADHETGGMAINSGARDAQSMGLVFTTKKHTAALVPVMAYGPGAEGLSAMMDNTEIYRRLCSLWSLEP